jgi:hypothetical protein
MAGEGQQQQQQGMQQQLVALSRDLDRMTEIFVRLVKSGRVDDGQDSGASASLPPGDLLSVLVEGLVSRACGALDKLDSLQKSIMLGNADRMLYDKVRASQTRLRDVSSCQRLFTMEQPGPLHDAQRLLNKLESEIYASQVMDDDVPPEEAGTAHNAAVNDLCAQALQAVVSTSSH